MNQKSQHNYSQQRDIIGLKVLVGLKFYIKFGRMRMEEFLQQLQGICFQESRKENRFFSQQQNLRKSSKLAKGAIPFLQSSKFKKLKKMVSLNPNHDPQTVRNEQQKISMKRIKEAQNSGGKKKEEKVLISAQSHQNQVVVNIKKKKQRLFTFGFEDKMKILRKIR